MAVTLPQDIQDKLDTAVADRDAAGVADADDAQAVRALVQAQQDKDAKDAASMTAHSTALDSAHVVIDALTAFLQLPGTTLPPSPAGGTPATLQAKKA